MSDIELRHPALKATTDDRMIHWQQEAERLFDICITQAAGIARHNEATLAYQAETRRVAAETAELQATIAEQSESKAKWPLERKRLNVESVELRAEVRKLQQENEAVTQYFNNQLERANESARALNKLVDIMHKNAEAVS